MSAANPTHAQLIGHVALNVMLIRQAAVQAKANDHETALQALEQIAADVMAIGETLASLADALECGPETVAVMQEGIDRIRMFRAFQCMEGHA